MMDYTDVVKNKLDKNGFKHEYWEQYYNTSKNVIETKGHYIHGVKHGRWEWFSQYGTIKHVNNFINGTLQGYAETIGVQHNSIYAVFYYIT